MSLKTTSVTRNNNNMTGDTCEAETTLPPYVFYCVCVAEFLAFCIVFCGSLFVISWVRVVRSLVFCVVFCKSLSVLLSFIFCTLCYLSFFV